MDKSVERGQAQLDALSHQITGTGQHKASKEDGANKENSMVEIIEQAIHAALSSKMPGALFAEPVLDALRDIRASHPADYANFRNRIKGLQAHRISVSVTELDKLTRPDQEDTRGDAIADKLVQLAQAHCELHRDAEGKGIAFVMQNGIRQVYYCASKGFSDWLRGIYFHHFSKGLSEQTVKTAVATLEAIGIHSGSEVMVYRRVGKTDTAYVLDIGSADCSVIVIGAEGWEIVTPSPIAMVRHSTVRSLPIPIRNGDLSLLWQHVNILEVDRPLVLAWMLECLRIDTPFPALELIGEQGSAKSTTQERLRLLIDPSKVLLRGRPKSTDDIFIAASNSHIVSYENLSSLTVEQQDALCVLATGGGYATRQLYSNGEEFTIELCRPVIWNGIATCATRPDLIERTLHLQLPRINSKERREETELQQAWERDYPSIFGGLLSLFSKSLAHLPKVHISKRERMADFQRLGEAMMQAMGHLPGAFTQLYANHIRAGVERALESSPVAIALEVFIESHCQGPKWHGTVGTLFGELIRIASHDRLNFPKSAKGLGDQLRRIGPAMRQRGIDVQIGEHTRAGRMVSIHVFNSLEEGKQPSPSSQSSPATEGLHSRDDCDDCDGHQTMISCAEEIEEDL